MTRAHFAVLTAALVCLLAIPLAAQTLPAAAKAPIDSLAAYSGATADCRAALQKAIALVAEGKWRSALAVLDAYDPKNADPFSLAMKTKLVLDGYVRSDMHRSFGLKDLAAGEEIATLRQSDQEEGELVPFDPPALAEAQIVAKTAAPPILSKELGDYYYDVQISWSGQWFETDEAIYKLSLENYQKAYEGKVFDADSLQNEGEILMRFERAEEAEPLFVKSVELEPKKVTSRYNYAICLILTGKKGAALDQLDMAIELLPTASARFEAMALGARTAAEAGDATRSESYLARAELLMPEDPSPGLLRHYVAVENKNGAAADKAADSLMREYASNPSVIRTLVSTWFGSGEAAAAKAFLERAIASQSDDSSLGALKFYMAVLLSQGEPTESDRTKGLALLGEAEAHMKKASPDEAGVFEAIARLRSAFEPEEPTAQ